MKKTKSEGEKEYLELLMQGKDPMYEAGRNSAREEIKDGAEKMDLWVIEALTPRYAKGYVDFWTAYEAAKNAGIEMVL